MTDHLRGLTLQVNNVAGDDDATDIVELCPDGRVYTVELQASNGAILRLQDSDIEILAGDTDLHRFVMPGLRWPAFARLVTRVGSISNLWIAYGNCGGP